MWNLADELIAKIDVPTFARLPNRNSSLDGEAQTFAYKKALLYLDDI